MSSSAPAQHGRTGPRLKGWARMLGHVLLASAVREAAGACAPSPVTLRIGDIQLSNGKTARGVEMGVGDPQQLQAFLPMWQEPGILLYGPDGYCVEALNKSWTTAGCTTFRGGSFDAAKSKTSKLPDQSENSLFGEDGAWSASTRSLDTVSLNGNTSVRKFPIRTPTKDWGQQGYHPLNTFGLGVNSTLLEMLKSSGKIGSRSLAYAWGRRRQQDGSIVLGGYDKARIKPGSKGYTQPITTERISQCPSGLVVSITDMVLNLRNGSDVSIFPSSRAAAILACVQPDLPVMARLPLEPYVDKLLRSTGQDIYKMNRSFGINWYNLRYKTGAKIYDGAMTINLGNSFSVRVENEDLVTPHTTVDESTGDTVVDSPDATGPDLLIDSMQEINANDMAQLGMYFVSAAYLMVNYDAGQFTLWESPPKGTSRSAAPPVDAVAVDTSNKEITEFCSTTTNTTEPPPPIASAPTKPPAESGTPADGSGESVKSEGAALSTGALVGIAVGSGAVVAMIAVGALMWYRKKKRASKGEDGPPAPEYSYAPADLQSGALYPQKTDYDGGYPSELHGGYAHSSELQGPIPSAELQTTSPRWPEQPGWGRPDNRMHELSS